MCGAADGCFSPFCSGRVDGVDLPSLLSDRLLSDADAFTVIGRQPEGGIGKRYGEKEKTFQCEIILQKNLSDHL